MKLVSVRDRSVCMGMIRWIRLFGGTVLVRENGDGRIEEILACWYCGIWKIVADDGNYGDGGSSDS